MWKIHAESMHQKLVPDNPKQPLHARNSFQNNILEEDYQKALKKFILLFLLNPFPFNEQDYKKQKGPRTSDQSLFVLQSRFRKINFFVMYSLTKFDDII